MDDEVKVVVEVPPTGGVSAPAPTEQVTDAVAGAIQIAAVADAIAQPAPELAEILRLQGDLIGEIRSLREEINGLKAVTAVSAEIVADAVEELSEEVEEVAEDAPAATIDIPLETIPETAATVEVAEIVPEVRSQKKSRKWI